MLPIPSCLPCRYARYTLAASISKYAISISIFFLRNIYYTKFVTSCQVINYGYLKIILDTWFLFCYNSIMKLYKRGKWSTKERQVLKDLYNKIPLTELSTRLLRRSTSITSQVNYLRKRGWAFHRRTDGSN